MTPNAIKVGELARRTGVSVRTLHHYHEIGLLSPSWRTAAGHRLYSHGDVARLLRIRALQQMGCSLEEVRDCLDRADCTPLRVLEMCRARLRADIERQRSLCTRLEAVIERLRRDGEVSTGEFLETIEEMTMFEKYYTPEQLKQLEQRREQIGEERIREVEAEWPELIAAVRAEMQKGTDPADPVMQELARRWQGLVEEFTGGDPGITQSLRNLYAGEPSARQRIDLDGGIMAYVGRALEGR